MNMKDECSIYITLKVTEEWKICTRNDNYAVSNFGRVKRIVEEDNTYVGRILKMPLNGRGYQRVCLCKNGIVKHCTVHTLIAEAFLGKRPKGYEINHIDGDKENNYIWNLEYVTQKENIQHAVENGLCPRGSNHYHSKLVESDILKIREMYKTGRYCQWEIADKFKVAKQHISLIVRKKAWAHI